MDWFDRLRPHEEYAENIPYHQSCANYRWWLETTVNAIVLSAYAIGSAAGPFMWKKQYQPRYVVNQSLRTRPHHYAVIVFHGPLFQRAQSHVPF